LSFAVKMWKFLGWEQMDMTLMPYMGTGLSCLFQRVFHNLYSETCDLVPFT